MKYCIHCGTELSNEAKFCSFCGKLSKLHEENSSKNTHSEFQQPQTEKHVDNVKKVVIKTTKLSKLFSAKIGRGDFALRYFPTIFVVYFDSKYSFLPSIFGDILSGIILLALILYGILLVIQRINDLGWSRWSALLGLVPIVNIIFAMRLYFKKGIDDK